MKGSQKLELSMKHHIAIWQPYLKLKKKKIVFY